MLTLILLSVLTTLLTTLKHDQAYDLWKQLELASELRDTVDWCEKWFVDFSAGKTQLVSFNLSNNIGAINLLVAFWNR